MSLDVCLHGEQITKSCTCEECGNEHTTTYRSILYSRNITHNLAEMAIHAKPLYNALWHPESLHAKTAAQLIEPVEKGLALLKSDPERFKKFDASNGWGVYEHLVNFAEDYLNACKKYPKATVSVSR